MADLPFSCTCGAVRGCLIDPSPRRGTHARCYCRDCQAFARHTGHKDDTLDAEGGTAIYQTIPSRVALDEGADRLRALRLSERGILRWYASCCGAPIANTLPRPGMPFCGVMVARLRGDAEPIGPVRYVAFTDSAMTPPDRTGRGGIVGLFIATLPRGLLAWLRGDKSSPFFHDHRPISEPHVLTEDERRRAYAA